jgi:hypothetical protein
MAKREFKDYTATASNGDEVSIRAHKLEEDGEVSTPTQTSVNVRKGQYLVETDRPNVYEVHSEDTLKDFLTHSDHSNDDDSEEERSDDSTDDNTPKTATRATVRRKTS